MRRLLAAVGLAVLVFGAGCLGGPPAPSDEDLSQEAEYDWDRDVNVTITVNNGQYRMVADVDESEVRLSQQGGFGGRNPVYVSAVQFQYANGTVVGADAIDVSTRDSRTVVEFPAANGTFAYTGNAGDRSLTVPVIAEGSHELVLPPGMRVSFPVFGVVEPAGYEKTIEDDRVHVHWESLDGGTVNSKFYLQQDLLLFGGVVGVLAAVAVAGVVYYRIRIRRLEDEREQSGLELDE
ncbi:DUF5803 family protein [Halobacterium wangiae]|uniref:DUF5803 family protein n=1 Tax=Halobacterium wangiae TaxID=2902623 RepID=UPI001E2C8B8B|nr:DUF5803 family protein [Halobacterium wangiae]